jgi:glycosyltransferase involved in cell wall biosynthesis
MRVRVFNTYWPVSAVAEDLLPYLAGLGWDVEFVVSRAPYRFPVEAEGGWRTREVGSFGVRADSRFGKAFVGLNYLGRALAAGLRGPRADCNVILTQPPLSGLLGLALKRLKGEPFCFVLQDVYPEMAVRLGVLREGAASTRLFSRLQRAALAAADRVIVIGRCMRDHALARGVEPERVVVIPNWPAAELREPQGTGERLRRDRGWDGDTVVMYAGNVGIPQRFDDLLAVAERLGEGCGVRFAVVGEGARKEELRAETARRGLGHVEFLPFLNDRYPLGEILRAGDLHFVPLRRACTGLAVPSKFYGVVAAGRPPVFQGDPSCEVARVIRETGAGWVVEEGDVDGLLACVEAAANGSAAAVRARVGELAGTLASARAPLEAYRDAIAAAAAARR